jgi:SAM-dependent methyltransferase
MDVIMNSQPQHLNADIAISDPGSQGVRCGACDGWADDPAGNIPFYVKGGSIQTALWRCQHCGTYIRDADYESDTIRGHFSLTSYTDPATEPHWRALRTRYFEYFIELAEIHLGRPLAGSRTLDFGTAFGILLELLRARGAKPEGVEVVPELRQLASDRGLVVHENLDQLVPQSYDLITAIDSFYYANNPQATLLRFRELLSRGGILVLRLTNRTWYFNLNRAIGRKITSARYDDIKLNYSVRGAVALLARSGFEIEKIYWSDKGRGDLRAWASIFYRVSPLIARYSPLRICPGMIVVARSTRPEA